MKLFFVGGEVRVFIPEQLVGNFARHYNSYIGVRAYVFAKQIHAYACAHGSYVERAEKFHDRLYRGDNVVFVYDDFGVFAADIIRYLSGVFKVYRVRVHAYRESAYRSFKQFCGYRAHERTVKPAGE